MTPADIERERERLIGELWRIGHHIGMPTEEHQRVRTEAMAEIRRALDALPPKPYAPTGELAGVVWVGHLLGSMPARPEPSEPESWRDKGREYDPMERAAEEFHWSSE
jgi:hypothetical protein